MIECENNYCIYWENKKCILSNIFINSAGLCMDCILISLSERELKEKRKKEGTKKFENLKEKLKKVLAF